jgi:hypothetical protein
VRQRNRATDHLVGLLGVNPQAEGEINGFIELRKSQFGGLEIQINLPISRD